MRMRFLLHHFSKTSAVSFISFYQNTSYSEKSLFLSLRTIRKKPERKRFTLQLRSSHASGSCSSANYLKSKSQLEHTGSISLTGLLIAVSSSPLREEQVEGWISSIQYPSLISWAIATACFQRWLFFISVVGTHIIPLLAEDKTFHTQFVARPIWLQRSTAAFLDTKTSVLTTNPASS